MNPIILILINSAIGVAAVPEPEVFIAAVEDAEVRNSSLDTELIRFDYGMFDLSEAGSLVLPDTPLARTDIRWTSVDAMTRIEETTQNAGESPQPTVIELCDGSGIFRWNPDAMVRTIETGVFIRTGDSGFAAFNQTVGYWFPGGDGPVMSLAERLRTNPNWTLEETAAGLRLLFDVEDRGRVIHHEIECSLDPVFHIRQYVWELLPAPGSDPEAVRLRREIVNEDWAWYGAMYLPNFAQSRLEAPASPQQGIDVDVVNVSEYIRVSAIEMLDPQQVDAVFSFPATAGDWIYDDRIHYGFQLGDDFLSINGDVYRADRPIWISDWADPMADLEQLVLSPVAVGSAAVGADESAGPMSPMTTAALAGLLTFTTLTGFRKLGRFRAHRKTPIRDTEVSSCSFDRWF